MAGLFGLIFCHRRNFSWPTSGTTCGRSDSLGILCTMAGSFSSYIVKSKENVFNRSPIVKDFNLVESRINHINWHFILLTGLIFKPGKRTRSRQFFRPGKKKPAWFFPLHQGLFFWGLKKKPAWSFPPPRQ